MSERELVISALRGFVESSELLGPLYTQTMNSLLFNASHFGFCSGNISANERMDSYGARPLDRYEPLYTLFRLEGFKVSLDPQVQTVQGTFEYPIYLKIEY